MPAKVNVGALLRRHLGKEVGDAVAAKIDQMIGEKKSPAEIERAIHADLVAHIEKGVTAAVIAKIGPLTPMKLVPIQSDLKSKIGPMSVSTKVGPAIKVKVGPGIKVNLGPPIEIGPGPLRKGPK